MKKYIFLAVLVALFAGTLMAQTKPLFPPTPAPIRVTTIREFTNCAQAVAPPSIIATGDEEIPCFQVLITYPTYRPTPPPPVGVQWHEFTATAMTTDSWCSQYPARNFSTPAQCAAAWYDRLAPAYQHMGLAMTSENTFCLWWMY